MSLLQNALDNNTPVVISCRNNHKMESVKNGKGKVVKSVAKERCVSKLFLRGDSVVIVVKA